MVIQIVEGCLFHPKTDPDLVGDKYNGTNKPVPDDDPME